MHNYSYVNGAPPKISNVTFVPASIIRHPDIRVTHGYKCAFTPIAITLYADVFIYKIESCSKTVFHKKVL
jgi:hypothetical protein